jgi:hypothetical protein
LPTLQLFDGAAKWPLRTILWLLEIPEVPRNPRLLIPSKVKHESTQISSSLVVTASKSRDSFPVGASQQSLLLHLSGLPLGRSERLPEFLKRGATAQRGADVQLAIFELLRELPNVRLTNAERACEQGKE